MSRAAQATRNTITLKGSTEIVAEFFGYSINSILYQRGIYPPESFNKVQKYGLSMLVTSDSGLQQYLQQVLSQLTGDDDPAFPPSLPIPYFAGSISRKQGSALLHLRAFACPLTVTLQSGSTPETSRSLWL